MFRLAKYLKPYTWVIILCVGLLFLQATSDLTLPDYMGRIINIGIQQGGVDSAVPSAIRQSQMDKLILFLTEEQQAEVLAAYTLVNSEMATTDQLSRYPVIATESVYVLTQTDTETINVLNPVMGKALTVVYGIQQAIENPDTVPQNMMGNGASGLDLSTLPEGADPFAMLSILPVGIRTSLLSQMDERFAAMGGDSVIVQAAAGAVKAEYMMLGVDTAALQNNYVLSSGFQMLLLTLFSVICAVVVALLSSQVAAGLASSLRTDVFKKVESFSNREFDKFSVSSLITRTTNDVNQLQMLVVMLIRLVVYAPILGVGGILKAVSTDASMWWTIVLAVVVLLSFIIGIFATSLPKFKVIQDLVDRLNLVTRENLSGMMVVRAFNTQKFEEKRFDKANQELTALNLFVNRVLVGLMPVMMLVMNGVTLLIIWVGAHQVAAGSMQVGDMLVFMQYAMQVVMGFLMMSIMFVMLPRASVSADRIADVLETEPSIIDTTTPKTFPKAFNGVLEFRNVSFRYPGAEEDVLHNLNFTAKPGQTTAFIGSTGSGKSTLVNLIPRFYDITDGAILLDGVDIRDVTQHDLREKIGYVPQRAMLFSGTIHSNLSYADEYASEEKLKHATDIAQATQFISEKTEGLKSEISQGGTNVSGGQRQRLSIARALVKDAPVYIFDDSFSALDFKTDSALRAALKDKTADSTVIIVTQRVSTIRHADQIIVLDLGRIVGMGTHDELMQSSQIYQEIALSQLGVGEIA
jgi:ATP-binding cassette subfamily B protein